MHDMGGGTDDEFGVTDDDAASTGNSGTEGAGEMPSGTTGGEFEEGTMTGGLNGAPVGPSLQVLWDQ